MEALTLNQIALAVEGRLVGTGIDGEATVTEVCTDSRKIKKGCLFCPWWVRILTAMTILPPPWKRGRRLHHRPGRWRSVCPASSISR